MFSIASGWAQTDHAIIAYAFNGFVFVNINCYHAGSSPDGGENIATISDSGHTHGMTCANTGSGNAHTILSPVIAVHYIIKV